MLGEVPKRLKGLPWKGSRSLVAAQGLDVYKRQLQIFDFPVPFAPPFYKLDFSEVPVLICSFAMGPVAGVASELLKKDVYKRQHWMISFRKPSLQFVRPPEECWARSIIRFS